jgi:RNA-binding protein
MYRAYLIGPVGLAGIPWLRLELLRTGTRLAILRGEWQAGSPGDADRRNVEITPKQRAHLKSLAHHLKPVLFVGKEGITDQTVRSLEEAFNTRELLKVKILEAAPMGTREGAEALAARIEGAVAVQSIGRVGVLYRPHPEKPEIELPS